MSASLFALGENGILDLVAANFRAPAYRSSQCLYLPLHTLPLREGRACNYLSILHSGLAPGGGTGGGRCLEDNVCIHTYLYIHRNIFAHVRHVSRLPVKIPLSIRPRPELLGACQTGSFKAALPVSFKGLKSSLSRSLLPEVGQCFYPPAPPSLPPPCSPATSLPQSHSWVKVGRGGRRLCRACPCVFAHTCKQGKKGGRKKL